MNTCQYAKHIVDSVPKDRSCTVTVPLMRLWIHNAPCCKDRMIRELAAYLMSLEDREHAVRVAVLVKAACEKTGLDIPLLEMVEQKTLFSTVVVADLARITPAHAVYYVEWMLGGAHLITSVAVRSKGDAERFPRDQLMVEHAPSLADGSLGAHVFHFFDGREASMFQFLLCSEISRRNE
jgi:hypothetical protein